MRIRTTSIADSDVAEAAMWLEQQRPGLGNSFLDAIEATFDQILRLPNVTFKLPMRFRLVARFPYRAIFIVQGDEIAVIAVLHASRDVEAILRARVGVFDY